MKRLGMVVLMLAVLCSGVIVMAQEKGSIKIGGVFSTSGTFAFLGDPEEKAFLLALEEINKAGGVGGRKLEAVSYDDEGNPGKTSSLIDRVLTKDKAIAVVGGSTSGTIHVISTAAENAKIPYLYISGNSALAAGKKFVFNAAPADEVDADVMIAFLENNLAVKKIGVLHDANEYGTRSAEMFAEKLKKSGKLTIVGTEQYQSKDRDFSGQLVNLRNAGSEAIVLWGVGFAPTSIIKNWAQLGMKNVHLMGGAGMGSKKMLEVAGVASDGVLFNTSLNYGDPNPREKAFIDAYKAKFGTLPTTQSAVGYDGGTIIFEALKKVGPDPIKIRDFIENMKGYKGVQGTYTYSAENHNGLIDCYTMALIKNQDYTTAEKTFPKKK
jgi:branched-chain amino acid transport system substrate-binding protein